jgi:hypothetical protein
METQQIHAAATQAGIPVEALDHVVRTVQAHFEGRQVKPAELAAYIQSLPVWTKIAMSYEAFEKMPPTWRAAQGWLYQPPPVSRKPDSRILTAEELETLKGLAWAERVTQGRAMQQSPPPQP